MKRAHAMPFGAELIDGVHTRFRLWAPGAERVKLELQGTAARNVEMTALADGWFETTVEAASGTRYRYRIDGDLEVPDPASRRNPEDVHGASEVVDPHDYEWNDAAWRGRPWSEAVIYELHVGAFSPDGRFAAVERRLDYLAELGVTAIELMPIADFPGKRNWGYDGVLPFAPDSTYGRPQDLKRLIASAHARGLMVLLDVVYNHFGPEGNYLNAYAAPFFTERHKTDWGAAIDFGSRTVRDFFIHNALYWLEEFNFDGLRFDAVHAIIDESKPHILVELAEKVRGTLDTGREIHLVLENDHNEARYLEYRGDKPRHYTAQWNDDEHHAFHVLVTEENDGYYSDYAQGASRHLGRCLTEGFGYQGEPSPYRKGKCRGEPSASLLPAAFVTFLQNHDQIGNRALGERLIALASPARLRAATAAWLLAPQPPLLFMGEEFGAATPFLFFCDFEPKLARAVSEGRRREFAAFGRFADKSALPDPSHPDTFERSKLDWLSIEQPVHAAWLALYKHLLRLRREHIAPRAGTAGHAGRYTALTDSALAAEWRLGDGSTLSLYLNLSGKAVKVTAVPAGELLHAEPERTAKALSARELPPDSAAVYLSRASYRAKSP